MPCPPGRPLEETPLDSSEAPARRRRIYAVSDLASGSAMGKCTRCYNCQFACEERPMLTID
jgi:hypothetical protein